MIKEDLIQFVWKYGLFNQAHLKTLQNQKLIIYKAGELNLNQGPDFFNSKIQLDDVTWAGNIEIHVKASDFYKHKHHLDPAFKNIILHVVYENDIATGDLPILELKDKINKNIITRFVDFQQNKQSIPCSKFINKADEFTVSSWLQRLSVERLENKVNAINELLLNKNLDWESVFWQLTFKYMGGTVNKQAFEHLALVTDFKLLIKNIFRKHFVEAYLFGNAGMLTENKEDEYYNSLKKEYQYIKNTTVINELKPELWKYMRMRPAAFPTIRISQLSEIIKKHPRIFSEVLNAENLNKLVELFSQQANEYWDNHYQFGVPSHLSEVKKVGLTQIDVLLINVVAPMLFAYGRLNNKPEFEDKAIELLEKLKPENNKIIREFKFLNIKCNNASDSQSLIELKTNYCVNKKCLSCGIGFKIFKNFVN